MRENAKTIGTILVIPLILLAIAFLMDLQSYSNNQPLLACTLATLCVHLVAAVVSISLKTEKFFDITATVAVLSMLSIAVLSAQELTNRVMLLALLCATWTTRLGLFLWFRIKRDHKDRRFDQIKNDSSYFFITWEMSATWTFITTMAALCAITSSKQAPITSIDFILTMGWLAAFAVEVCADQQKSRFKQQPQDTPFIQTGLWQYSRHPNYLGEILMWVFIAGIALPNLYNFTYLALLSPLFVYWVLTRLSGINLLEQQNDKQYGHLAEYSKYKEHTPVLWPNIFKLFIGQKSI